MKKVREMVIRISNSEELGGVMFLIIILLLIVQFFFRCLSDKYFLTVNVILLCIIWLTFSLWKCFVKIKEMPDEIIEQNRLIYLLLSDEDMVWYIVAPVIMLPTFFLLFTLNFVFIVNIVFIAIAILIIKPIAGLLSKIFKKCIIE